MNTLCKAFVPYCLFCILILGLSPVIDLAAQAPDSVNYQAVARDDQGKVLANEQIKVRMKIFAGQNSGDLVYKEEHSNVSTNQFGLFTLYIGGASQTGGSAASFDSIDWGNAPHHIEVEVDAGSGYESLGSRKFASVPYALYAKEAGTGGGTGSSDSSDLQLAYDRGNTISLDSLYDPFSVRSDGKRHLHVDSSAVRMGHTKQLDNTQLDVRYDASPTPGPAVLGASAPAILPNFVFQNPAFQSVNTGVFGVGLGTGRAIGVTGFSVHNNSTPAAQDSIYGVTGIATDQVGKTSVGLSGIARAHSNTVQRSVGIYAFVDDQKTTDYQSDPFLAGGVFDANIDAGHTSLDTTYGVVGIGGRGGDHAVGVYGYGRGDPTATSQVTYGVLGQAGIASDTNIGVLGQGNFVGSGNSIAGLFRFGKTVVQDTLQLDYGSPNAGEFLKALDAQGNAVWDSVPGGGTPIALQDAYSNGHSIALTSGAPFRIQDNSGAYNYLHIQENGTLPRIGIGTGAPGYELHVEGRTYSRDGMLVHDTAHYRYDTAKVRYEGISGDEFRASSGSGNVNDNGHFYFNSILNEKTATAPLDLPDGAIVDSVYYYVKDSSTAVNIKYLQIEETSYGANGGTTAIFGTVASSGGSGGAQTLIGYQEFTINNEQNVYRIHATFPTGADSDLRLANVKIRYRVKKAD